MPEVSIPGGVKFTDKEVDNFRKKLTKSVKNNPTKAVMFFLLVIIILLGLVYWLFILPLKKENKNLSLINQQLSASLLQATKLTQSSPSTQCISGKFPDNKNDWLIQQYEDPNKNAGFYCPRLKSEFYSPEIWYTSSIPTKFESIEFRYKIKNKNEDIDILPSFIVSFGGDPNIFRFYLPLETNKQVVGFEKIIMEDSKYSLKRETPQNLKKPVKEDVENEIKIRMDIVEGNKVIFIFNLTYISAIKEEESMSIDDSISYTFSLPHDPKPGSEFSETEIGFGTFKGSCVKPISYKFCY